MGSILNRRRVFEKETGSIYPYVSNYPEFNEYGVYILQPVEGTTSGNTNTYMKSGSTSYGYMSGEDKTRAFKLDIGSESIVVYRYYGDAWTTVTTKTFAGFPVKFKRCSGGENNAPTVTFTVSKEA